MKSRRPPAGRKHARAARKIARPSARLAALQATAKMERSLANCEQKIDALEHDLEVNIRRMGAMQAEIDYLRAQWKAPR
jgi:hypothetical protein